MRALFGFGVAVVSSVRFSVILCVALSISSVPAAAQVGYGVPDQGNTTLGIDNGLLGKLGGAAVGALIGSQIGKGNGNLLATGAGGLLGFFAGGYLMDQLSPGTRDTIQGAETRALDAPVGRTIAWNSPDSPDTRGTITPVRAGRDQYGRECKEFEHVVIIDGRQETARGTTCRGDDGQWRLAAPETTR